MMFKSNKMIITIPHCHLKDVKMINILGISEEVFGKDLYHIIKDIIKTASEKEADAMREKIKNGKSRY